jgi:hypothetical protein
MGGVRGGAIPTHIDAARRDLLSRGTDITSKGGRLAVRTLAQKFREEQEMRDRQDQRRSLPKKIPQAPGAGPKIYTNNVAHTQPAIQTLGQRATEINKQLSQRDLLGHLWVFTTNHTPSTPEAGRQLAILRDRIIHRVATAEDTKKAIELLLTEKYEL